MKKRINNTLLSSLSTLATTVLLAPTLCWANCDNTELVTNNLDSSITIEWDRNGAPSENNISFDNGSSSTVSA